MTRRLVIRWAPDESVTGRLAMPRQPAGPGVLLAHGAGAGQDSPFIVAIRDGIAAAGHPVLTFNYPYTEAGRRAPDRPPKLLACHAAAAARLRGYSDTIVLAGKSMGGRIGSHLAADGEAVSGLVYYAYPIVAPGKSEARDTGHLDAIGAPMLFFSGTKDPLSPLAQLELLVARLDRVDAAIIEGGNHSFRVPKSSGLTQDEVMAALVRITVDWLAELAGPQCLDRW